MTKLSKHNLDPKRFGEYVNNLWSAFTLMDTKADIRLLFKDLFTHTEYKMFAKRLEIGRRLVRQESYQAIMRELNVTPRTITTVNNILATQGNGLRKAIEKLDKLEEKYLEKQREKTKNLENPFRKKVRQKTILGTALKLGLHQLDKTISRKIKHRSAKKTTRRIILSYYHHTRLYDGINDFKKMPGR